MERLKEKMLARVRPEAMSGAPAKWQQQKAAETRVRILEATIDCLVDHGYAGLSTNEVTQRAGISRGAMHHHFASRMDLVGAAIEYTFYQRMKHFLSDYFEILRGRGPETVPEIATELHWQSVQTREYAAYIELAVAARTNAELNAHFEPASRRFDKVWTQEMIEAFPQWRDHWDRLQIASDFATAAHMGLLLNRPVFGKGARQAAVRDLIARAVMTLYEGLEGIEGV